MVANTRSVVVPSIVLSSRILEEYSESCVFGVNVNACSDDFILDVVETVVVKIEVLVEMVVLSSSGSFRGYSETESKVIVAKSVPLITPVEDSTG